MKATKATMMLGTALAVFSAAAHAQSASTAEQAANGGQGLAEIIVTANKTSSSEQKTPIALRVISGEEISAAGVTNVAALQRVAPDLGITTDTIYTKLALRGVTAETIAEGADAALPVNIDGEYINRPIGLNASFFDLERIEVLKGPQGTLYGRNSTAGAINIITAKPTDRFEGSVSAGYGNFNALNFQAAVNIPLAEGLAVRFAGIHSEHDGYRRNGIAGRNDDANTDGVRGTIGYRGARVEAFLQGEYINIDQTSPAQYGVPITTTTQGVNAFPISGGGIDYLPNETVFTLPKNNYPLLLRGFIKSEQYHLRGKLDFSLTDDLHLVYSGGYTRGNTSDYVPLSGTPNALQFVSVNPKNNVRSTSQEIRLSYAQPDGLTLQGGLFYFHEKYVNNQSIQIDSPPFGPPGSDAAYVNAFYRPGIKTESLGLFAQGDYPLTETLKITAGGRYTWDKKRGTYYNFSGFGFINPGFGLALPTQQDIATAVGGMPAACSSASAAYNGGTATVLNQCYGTKGQFNWLAGIDFTPAPTHMIYAKVSTGYRSGGFDNLTSQIVNGLSVGVFQPEKITAYEVGSKNRFADNKLQLNVAAFHYDYKDLQIDNFINTTIGHATVNAGKARFNGVEMDFQAAITPHDRFTLTANYLDAKLTQFIAFSTGINGGTPSRDLSGNRPPQAPKITVAMGYDHIFSLGSMGNLKASIYSRLKSAYYLTSINNRGDRQEGYSQTDLSLTYTTPSQNLSVRGYVNNVENYVPLVYAGFTGGPPINLYNFTFGAPRTYGVNATYKF